VTLVSTGIDVSLRATGRRHRRRIVVLWLSWSVVASSLLWGDSVPGFVVNTLFVVVMVPAYAWAWRVLDDEGMPFPHAASWFVVAPFLFAMVTLGLAAIAARVAGWL
jgi:hypothetical protein